MKIYILGNLKREPVKYQGSINGKRVSAAFVWFRSICRLMGISKSHTGYLKLDEIGSENRQKANQHHPIGTKIEWQLLHINVT